MSNQKASLVNQLNLPFDSLSIGGEERGKLYKNKNWLYQKYWVEKLSMSEIGKIYGISDGAIWEWMKKFNIKRRAQKEAQNIEDRLYKHKSWLYQKYVGEKLSMSQIAKLCGVNLVTIFNWMERFAIKRRALSESAKMAQNRPEVKKKMSETQKIVQNYPDVKKRHREATIAACRRPEVRKKHREAMKARWSNPDYRKRMSDIFKARQNRPEIKKKNSRRQEKRWENPEYFKKMCQMSKELWCDPEHVKKMLHCRGKSPNKLEKRFDEMTPKNVRFTGDGAWWRKLDDGKHHNPDFKITGQNKVVEIYGDYWHRNDNPQDLIDLYNEAGLGCLIFWEREVYKQPEQVKEKVKDFINAQQNMVYFGEI